MEQKTEYILDMLTSDSVSILQKKYFEFNNQKYYTGNIRNAYMNSQSGRQQIAVVLPEEYYNAVIGVWGETPTVDDPTKESEEI